MTDTMRIPLTKMKVWEGNVRKIYADEAVSELAASIAAHGLLKSLIVRKVDGGEYAVVDGGLRLCALQRLAKKGILKENPSHSLLSPFRESERYRNQPGGEHARAYAPCRRIRGL